MQPFGKEWFKKHQKKLVWLLNNRVIGSWFRSKLGITYQGRITRLDINHFTYVRKVTKKKVYATKVFLPGDIYAQNMYKAFKPLWWAMHVLDFVIDPTVPQYSFGFSTLTKTPVAGNVSGYDTYLDNINANFATGRGAATGVNAIPTAGQSWGLCALDTGNYYFYRTGMLFDTSSIGAGQTIQTTTKLTLNFDAKGSAGANVSVVTFSPASTSSASTGDFGSFGTTKVFNDYVGSGITLNTNVDSTIIDTTVISTSSFTKLGVRERDFDLANSAPATTSYGLRFQQADNGANMPTLTVDYIAAASPSRLALLGVG